VLILGILVFLNGFIFTVLLLMVSREMAHPAATPTEVWTATRTVQPTSTSTVARPTATSSPTKLTEPTITNTMVVPPVTSTSTVEASTPTSTAVIVPTATLTTGAPTATSVPPTPTSTLTPTATATPEVSYEFRYSGTMESAPNCGTVYMRGLITGVGGEPVDGRTVRLRFADRVAYRISGEGESPGVWGFSPLAPQNYHSPFTFLIDVVESQSNPVGQSDVAEIQFTDCSVAGQFTNIVFVYAE
jgi:hypothetical protein